MLQHNALLRRGASMSLNGNVNTSKLTHCSLDVYLLQMHSMELAEILGCFSTFGRRMLPLVLSQPESDGWWLSEQVLVQRHHWFLLCRCMMNLLRLLGLDTMVDDASSNAKFPLTPWPDFPSLRLAVAGVQEAFGGFQDADRTQPNLLQLYFPLSAEHFTSNPSNEHNGRGGVKSTDQKTNPQ
jgi:hypothetical protein